MPTRRTVAAAVLGLAATPVAALAHGEPTPPLDSAAVDARRDLFQRLTVSVRVGEAGPFGFVVDCGADRSVLADDIAGRLALPPGPDVLVHGVAGAERMPTVKAPPLLLGGLKLAGGPLPVLPRERLGSDGLLGVDALAGRRLVMDFRRGELTVARGSTDTQGLVASNEAYVDARPRFGMMTVVDARAAGRSVNAFIDSGGGLTVASKAMAAAMRARGQWTERAPLTELTGVTSHVLVGEVRILDRLSFGALSFTDVPLAVCDLHLFERWGLTDEPTLLLGANVLRLFSRVELDYRRRRILFRTATPEVLRA